MKPDYKMPGNSVDGKTLEVNNPYANKKAHSGSTVNRTSNNLQETGASVLTKSTA